jgi:hypothetical protein
MGRNSKEDGRERRVLLFPLLTPLLQRQRQMGNSSLSPTIEQKKSPPTTPPATSAQTQTQTQVQAPSALAATVRNLTPLLFFFSAEDSCLYSSFPIVVSSNRLFIKMTSLEISHESSPIGRIGYLITPGSDLCAFVTLGATDGVIKLWRYNSTDELICVGKMENSLEGKHTCADFAFSNVSCFIPFHFS